MTTTTDVLRALGATADALARALGVAPEDRERLAPLVPLLGPHPDGGPVPGRPDPTSLGAAHEALLDPEHRRRRGVHYTPPAAAATLVALALGHPAEVALGASSEAPLLCDPSCGGGVFLLAAADHLVALGRPPAAALAAVAGIDLDPGAVEVARAALVLWAAAHGLAGDALVAAARQVIELVVVGDALVEPWPGEGALAAVVGNPPFGGQLARRTARDRAAGDAARALLGGTAAGYTDTAALFLVRAAGAVAPGGRVVLLQPVSFLGSRDAGAVRRRLDDHANLEAVWLPGERLFGASVDVCAPVLALAEPLAAPSGTTTVAVRSGPTSEVVAEVPAARLAGAGSWAPVLAAATGVPAVDLSGRPLLGEWVRATAGFRDEFYALVPFVADRPELAPGDEGRSPALPEGLARLVTAGLIDPACTSWGHRPTRLAGRRLLTPTVDVAALRARADGPDGDRRLAAWADARLRPKVVVATQTRVVEAAVDHDGSWWPSVPVVSVVLDPELDDEHHRLLVLAALTAPPASAWAAERSGGTALAPQALKLSARQVREVPLPVDRERWEEGARRLARVAEAADPVERARALAEAGRLLTDAHRLPAREAEAVLAWWAHRAGCDPHI